MTRPVWFQLEVIGVGKSNIVILSEKTGFFMGGSGGDRTGTDREGINVDKDHNNVPENNSSSGNSDDEESFQNKEMKDIELSARSILAIPAVAPWVEIVPNALEPSAPSQGKPEINETQTAHNESARITAADDKAPSSVIETTAAYDPEQTAPEPGFSVNAVTVLFLIAAFLCFGALLILRLNRRRRCHHEKP